MSAAEGATGPAWRPPGSVGPKRTVAVPRKRLRREIARAYAEDPDLEGDMLRAQLARPKERGHCAGGERPCPFVSCRFHLALDVSRAGSIVYNFPGVELEDMPATCALDVSETGPLTQDEVAVFLNVCGRQRVQQIEEEVLLLMREEAGLR
jgi:hypothetical protein